MRNRNKKIIIAFVGMPGAGKSEAASYLKAKGVAFVRFGQITDDGLMQMRLPLTPQNEQMFREKIRQDLGMSVYAIKAKPKIDEFLAKYKVIGIDGLYSWEEYVYLKEQFPQLLLIHIFAEATVRYQRLSIRPERPLTPQEARRRDITELEKLNKGGPIAIADYLIDNSEDLTKLHEKIDKLLTRLHNNV